MSWAANARASFVLRNKVAVVTNSAEPPGLLLAAALAQAGAAIVLTAPDMAALEAAYAEFEPIPGVQVLGVDSALDTAQSAALVVARTLDTFGRLDVWVNNALPTPAEAATLRSETPSAWGVARRLLDSTILGTWAATTQMRHQGHGTLVNVFGARDDDEAPFFSMANNAIAHYTRRTARDALPHVYTLALPDHASALQAPDETWAQTLMTRLMRLVSGLDEA
nr:SDR family NAD(P)-dependent oxidoreductase [Ardenticatena sp.]